MSKKFKYSLESLLNKRTLDLSAIVFDEMQANSAVIMIENEILKIDNEVKAIESAIRDSMQQGHAIDPREHHRVMVFRSTLADKSKLYVEHLEKAKQIQQTIHDKMLNARKEVRVLEKDRSNKQDNHKYTIEKLEQNKSDELWLVTRDSKTIGSVIETANEGD